MLPNLDKMNTQEKDKFYRTYFEQRHKENNIHGYSDAVKLLDEQLKSGEIEQRIYDLAKDYEAQFWYLKK